MASKSNMQGQHHIHSESKHSLPSPEFPSSHLLSSSSPLQQYHDLASPSTSTDFERLSYPSDDAMDRPRTVSREGSILRHPTPDLQSIQGAYLGNIERLEQSAERLSLSSDIGEELRKMRIEQRRSSSRRSSILGAHNEEREVTVPMHRQFSYEYGSHASNSIVGTNNIARNGGFSPAGYYASPRGSVQSGSWSHHNSIKERSVSYGPRLEQLSEPDQEGKSLSSPLSNRVIPVAPQPEPTTNPLGPINDDQFNLNNVEIPHTRPDESEMANNEPQPRASSDTYRQAAGLFTDFDGVHIAPQSDDPVDLDETASRRVSSQPVPARPVSYMQPAPDESMVYYPAPVPMMLNLPKRLSKLPAALHRDKRRSELLNNLPTEARQSAVWLPDVQESANDHVPPGSEEPAMQTKERKRRTMAEMPPQLRATMFFDYPSTHQEVEVKGGSAVATLDSILDASAFAPVSAFTDHPIAGRVGPEVYGKTPARSGAGIVPPEDRDPGQRRNTINLLSKRNSSSNVLEKTKKRNSSLLNFGGKRKSSAQQLDDTQESHEADAADLHGEDAPLHRSYGGFDGLADEESDFPEARGEVLNEGDQVDEPEEAGEYNGAPTTLLAELQLRKLQQKQRGRTAATAFPNGMHSTLLQLDAVAQVQKQSRRQKHTRLAWEGPEDHTLGAENQDDDDVPLGVLFPGRTMNTNDKSRLFDEDRPLGLIASRDMEDNEPLSHRRARLRGEDPAPRFTDPDKRNSMYTLDLPNFSDETPQAENDNEDETLAQRIRRLKATNIPTQPRPVSGEFASEVLSQFGGLSPADVSKDEGPAPVTGTKSPGPDETLGQRRRRLQDEANKSRNVSGESNKSTARPAMTTKHSLATILSAHPAAGAGTRSFNEIKFAPAPKTRNTAWAMDQTRKASMGPMRGLPMASGVGASNGDHINGVTATAGANGFPSSIMQEPVEAVNPRQNEMVDRWRQSVMF